MDHRLYKSVSARKNNGKQEASKTSTKKTKPSSWQIIWTEQKGVDQNSKVEDQRSDHHRNTQ